MSWQATAWALKQRAGSANKLTLVALANYADPSGVCWPTQETLAKDTEQSVDTVQRRIKKLVALGLVRVERRTPRRGQWAGRMYFLSMDASETTKPQSAARSSPEDRATIATDVAAMSTSTTPQPSRRPNRTALRLKPSIEPPIEPSRPIISPEAAERMRAFEGRQEGMEIVQNRIAQRLGPDGWLILGGLDDDYRAKLTSLERQRKLDDTTLAAAALHVRSAQPKANPTD